MRKCGIDVKGLLSRRRMFVEKKNSNFSRYLQWLFLPFKEATYWFMNHFVIVSSG